jgi:hypothetical protein
MGDNRPPTEREIRAQLRALIDEVARDLGERKTVAEILHKMLPDAVELYRPLVPQAVARMLRPMIRRALGYSRRSGGASAQLPLLGFEAFDMPVHLVVPPDEALEEEHVPDHDFDDDEEFEVNEANATQETPEDHYQWVVLQRAQVKEADKNVRYRDNLMEGARKRRDLVYAVVESAREAGAGDDDVIGDVLRR